MLIMPGLVYMVLGVLVGAIAALIVATYLGSRKANNTIITIAVLAIVSISTLFAMSLHRTAHSAEVDALIATRHNMEAEMIQFGRHPGTWTTRDFNNRVAIGQRRAARWWGFTYDDRIFEIDLFTIPHIGED